MTIAGSLAERIAAVTYDLLPAEAVHWAKVAITDTVGVHAGRFGRTVRAHYRPRDDGRRIRRPMPDLRHRPTGAAAGCGAGQRHGIACAGL